MTGRPTIQRALGALAVVATMALVSPVAAQSPGALPATGEPVRLLTHGSFALSQGVLDEFAALTGSAIQVLPAQDAGSAVNQAILTRGNPVADVLYGVDDTFLSRALEAGIFEPYQPLAAATLPEAFQLDPERRAHLVRRIASLPQAFVTTTTLDDLDPSLVAVARSWEVRADPAGARLVAVGGPGGAEG